MQSVGPSGSGGGAVADEPRAAFIARQALSAGGNATDAAVAAYFALSVTYPSAAGLGGGGVCLVHDTAAGEVRALDFLARVPTRPAKAGMAAAPIPGGVRGMIALHARYGRLRLEQLIQPAEHLARFGHRISRAFAVEIAADRDRLASDPETRRLFFRDDGRPLAQGDNLVQVELAATLAKIRLQGAGDFYGGDLAKRYAEGAARLGRDIDVEDLRGYKPAWVATVTRPFGNHAVHFPGGSLTAGETLGRLWDELQVREGFEAIDRGSSPARTRAVLDAMAGAYAGTNAVAGAAAPGGTGLVVVDRDSGAVACVFTMNGRFGSGRMIRGSGALLAAAPAQDPAASIAALLMANKPTRRFQFAAVASQGRAAPGAMMLVVARTLSGDLSAERALAAPRAHPSLQAHSVVVEADGSPLSDRIRAAGLSVEQVDALALVNLINCVSAAQDAAAPCDYRADPRGHGIAAGLEQ
jgi:gamma-glutamyltranspeptidase/glutathione hydrolase